MKVERTSGQIGNEASAPGSFMRRRGLQAVWVLAFLGLAVPAIGRFLFSPLDDSTVTVALILGVILAVVGVYGLTWLATLPVALRERALKASFPGRETVTVAELSSSVNDFSTKERGGPNRKSEFLPNTVVVMPDRLDFWSGNRQPTRFASVSRVAIRMIQRTSSSTGIRKATGLRLVLSDSASVDFVPVGRLGAPLPRKSFEILFKRLSVWHVADRES